MRGELPLILGAASLLAGCGTLPGGGHWGEDATPLPGWGRLGRAAAHAALDPGTWAPAAGAVVLGAGGFDHRISNWAVDHTPIFSSNDSADSASSTLRGFLHGAAIATTLATPSGSAVKDWVPAKAEGFAVEVASWEATTLSVDALKNATGRTRPNRVNDQSFPSSNASDAFDFATQTSRNLDSIQMPGALRTGLQVGAYTLAGTSAWARVEAGAHFPSDVLAGAALGHFLGSFFHDAFLGLKEGEGPGIEIVPEGKGAMLVLDFRF